MPLTVRSTDASFSRKILVIAPAWVGDMVMAQSLFKLIKEREPQARIDVLAPAWSEPLLACMPEVTRTWISPFAHGELNLLQRYQLAQQLRAENYQQAILLPNSFKSALVPFLAGIPRRTGWRGEMRWGLLNDVRYLNKAALPLMVQRFTALALNKSEKLPDDLPLPALQSSAQQQQAVREKLMIQQDNRPILALCPGAEYGPAKRWPIEHFAEVARVKNNEGWQVWIIGSNKDAFLGAGIQHAARGACQDFTGKTSLDDAIHLLAMSDYVISNDSGLMHVAAALHKPLIALYGSSSPKFTPPLSDRVKILDLNLSCSPCFARECPLGHFRCMRELMPAQVLQALASF